MSGQTYGFFLLKRKMLILFLIRLITIERAGCRILDKISCIIGAFIPFFSNLQIKSRAGSEKSNLSFYRKDSKTQIYHIQIFKILRLNDLAVKSGFRSGLNIDEKTGRLNPEYIVFNNFGRGGWLSSFQLLRTKNLHS